MKGHVKLGASVADLREYMLTDPNSLGMQLSNQMAAKLGQGAGKYDDLQDWSAWVMDNWSAGAGTVDAEGGGFLFGDVDSHVPRQLLLPPAQGIVDTAVFDYEYRLTPGDLTAFGIAVEEYSSSGELTWTVKAQRNGALSKKIWLYASIPFASTITVKLYSAAAALLQTDTYTATVRDSGFRWHAIGTTYNLVAGTSYILQVSVNADWQVAYVQEYTRPFFVFQDNGNNTPLITKIARFNGNLYGTSGSALYKYNTTDKRWVLVAGSVMSMCDLLVWNNKLYIGTPSGNFYTMSTAEAFSAGATTGSFFCKWNGYLYRVVGDSLYYTADGTTWSGPFKAEPNENILGMAGMGNDLYFANLNGLYRFAPGDTIFGVAQWGKRAGYIGKITESASYPTDQGMPGMVSWQGDIYIAVDGQIIRYSANGQVTEVWLKDSGDLPSLYTGRICSLSTMNNYLIATVAGSDSGHSVWAWNRQGWHCIGTLLQGSASYTGVYSTFFDRELNRLWVNHYSASMYIVFYDITQNPYTLNGATSTSLYMPSGWMETHWFDGNLIEIRKDFESVYVTGDTLGANDGGNTSIKVYWMDDESTGWELLGTAAYPRTEIRWSNATTRPNSRQIKIALQLNTESVLVTPKLEAVRIKYMSMLLDRYRWTLPLSLSVNQEMLDNTLNSYTLAQQVTHVNSLINSVAPIYFEDVDGVQYAVKVLGASRSVRDFEYRNPSTAKVYKYVYNIVIEQVASNINT